MAKFQENDRVVMPGIPLPPVTVLEVKRCEDTNCPYEDQEIFRFVDPQGFADWMHSAEFEKV